MNKISFHPNFRYCSRLQSNFGTPCNVDMIVTSSKSRYLHDTDTNENDNDLDHDNTSSDATVVNIVIQFLQVLLIDGMRLNIFTQTSQKH